SGLEPAHAWLIRIRPRVGLVMYEPPARAVKTLRGLAAVLGQGIDEVEHRPGTFSKIGAHDSPVVHGQVDVVRVVGAPDGAKTLDPKALQGYRQASRT